MTTSYTRGTTNSHTRTKFRSGLMARVDVPIAAKEVLTVINTKAQPSLRTLKSTKWFAIEPDRAERTVETFEPKLGFFSQFERMLSRVLTLKYED